jgi:hypothetical protein
MGGNKNRTDFQKTWEYFDLYVLRNKYAAWSNTEETESFYCKVPFQPIIYPEWLKKPRNHEQY